MFVATDTEDRLNIIINMENVECVVEETIERFYLDFYYSQKNNLYARIEFEEYEDRDEAYRAIVQGMENGANLVRIYGADVVWNSL